ncbi:MAG: trehalase, partial [Bacteroidetes bacterium]|nr:trehalase [Bacteroidota bacterium]
TLINLPYSYIVPGGRFREIYYWDSYFTALGLQVSKRTDIIQDMIDNFAFLINEFGFIPNGNRTYYLGRSQPPFFALFVQLLAEEKGKGILLKYRNELEKEYAFWMNGEDQISSAGASYQRLVLLQDGTLMNRYYDNNKGPRPEAYIEDIHIAGQSSKEKNITYTHIRAAAESGWDFSTRWFTDGKNMSTIETTDLIPVDLNCILVFLEETLSETYSLAGEKQLQNLFQQKINSRKKAINDHCWNEGTGFYFDYNHATNTHTNKYTLAATFPLFFGVASNHQAEKVAKIIEEQFLHSGGLITTTCNSGQQWDAPNGWAPLQWIAYKGLKRYGFKELAKKIKTNWVKNCEAVYQATGKMMEKYNVVDTFTSAGGGEYPNQDGFGWTNGVYLKMKSEED